MRFSTSKCGQYVFVLPEGSIENKYLSNFPGLLRSGPNFFIPRKHHVVYHIVQRLRAFAPKIVLKVDPDLREMATTQSALVQIPEDAKFFTKPNKAQEVALRFLLTVKSGGVLLEPGMGKTKLYLDFVAIAGFKKAIVVCPLALTFVWEDDALTHRPDKKVYVIKTTDWESEIEGINSADIVVVNYAKAVILKDKLKSIKWDGVNLDEGLIKDYRSIRTNELTDLFRDTPSRVVSSGSLVNNTPIDAFAPIRFIEPAICGTSVTRFKDRYCVLNKKNPGIIFGFKNQNEIQQMINTCCIVMTKAEWLPHLPKKTFFKRIVQMSDSQRESYLELKSSKSLGDDIIADNPLVLASKLLQISNGFYYKSPPESFEMDMLDILQEFCLKDSFSGKKKPSKRKKSTAKRETVFFQNNTKLEELRKLITEDLSGRRFILWYNYAAEVEMISKLLKEMNINFSVIQGGEKDVGAKVREFNKNPTIQILLCQAKSVNYGVTILGTKEENLDEQYVDYPDLTSSVYTQVFYSLSFSLEVFTQQQDRIHRLGQEKACEYYVLLSNTPIELWVWESLENKLEIRRELLIDFIHQMS